MAETRPVRILSWLALAWLLGVPLAASAHHFNLARYNRRLAGCVVDFTNNGHADRRFWSPTLHERRDLYVYLPPGFDARRCYPVIVWMHGVDEDERTLLGEGVLVMFDRAMAAGRLPPTIIAMPDGSISGRPRLWGPQPLWLNSAAGPFEDYLALDVWGFLVSRFPVCPERQGHVLAGFSGGGAAAFRIAMTYPDRFGTALGVHPPLNIRWLDCHGRYRAPFDPNCWGWRTDVSRGREALARFYLVYVVRVRQLVYPLFGRGPEAVAGLSRNNPIEMLTRLDVRPDELAMYVAYAGRDEFNITAQVESFVYRACQLGLRVGVGYDPNGRHSWATARKLLPGAVRWLAGVLAPYAPPCAGAPAAQDEHAALP
jgi:S-formylglutathione hydrolase FrmB